jgi:SAM-dependent methyltransferase
MGKSTANATLVLGDGRALPVANGTVDAVVATFPAGYILERATLREAHRVLAAEGRLVVVGLWVALELGGWERWIPLFYGRPAAARLSAILGYVEGAGFRVQPIEEKMGRFAVGGLVATRVDE